MTGSVLDALLFAAICLALMAGFPVAFTLGGVSLLFAALGVALGVFDPTFLHALPQRIFGTMTNEVLIAVPLFVFMGVMLEKSRVAEDLLETMGALFGPVRGGLAISVTFVGALLAASTGVVGATVVTMGLLSLPTMLRRGYSPKLACGSIAAAGTLGQIIPPSIVLVILADLIASAYQKAQLEQGVFAPETVSVSDLFAGALVPGLVLAALYMVFQALVAWLRPETSPAMPAGERSVPLATVMTALVPPVALILCVLGSILAGIATPTEAASVGSVGTILLAGARAAPARRGFMLAAWAGLAVLVVLVGLIDTRLGRSRTSPAEWAGIAAAALAVAAVAAGIGTALVAVWRAGVLVPVMRSAGEITSMVFVILIGATLFTLVFRGLGGEETVQRVLVDLPGGTLGAVAVVMLVMFAMGFFIDFLEIVFIVVPITAPVLLKLPMPDGTPMSPVWLGVLMAVNLQTSFLTPPFGFALFYLRGVAPPSVKTSDIYLGIIPFVAIQVLCLGILWLFPGLATRLPAMIGL
ncbi:TRAP transporter large permease [Prosthecomicrobium sp. N25]|uniref:TRAP transporter large permease n=1 Tax=Prosthecomicrobium sp. N25 TaxID=3129254 RepID=UPI00307810D5